jgi:hypothetical protein
VPLFINFSLEHLELSALNSFWKFFQYLAFIYPSCNHNSFAYFCLCIYQSVTFQGKNTSYVRKRKRGWYTLKMTWGKFCHKLWQTGKQSQNSDRVRWDENKDERSKFKC